LGDHTLCHFIINPLDFAMAAECASLLTLNLAMLRDHDEAEENRLLSACKAAGVFYLSFEGSGETVNQTTNSSTYQSSKSPPYHGRKPGRTLGTKRWEELS
jgi:hypothetical protein